MRPRAMTSLEKSPITIPSDVPSPDRLPLVETPRHEKDDTQDQYGDHASGQKTAAVTSHEIHHVGSRKWLILRPKRIASIPSSNRPRTHGGAAIVSIPRYAPHASFPRPRGTEEYRYLLVRTRSRYPHTPCELPV